jgi:hypothetical protein
MASYLGQLDIDVCIYIADGDREYQFNARSECEAKEQSWKLFSEIALSQDRPDLTELLYVLHLSFSVRSANPRKSAFIE